MKLIPNTDLQVSAICLGTGGFGTSVQSDESMKLLDAYVEEGGNFIDTAHNYGDWDPQIERSASEKIIGRWLKKSGVRNQVTLATKGGHPKFDAPHVGRLKRKDIFDDCLGSLSALGVQSIDLYWLHADDLSQHVEDIMDVLFSLQDAGSIRYFGASNWQTSRIRSANEYAGKCGRLGFVADQTLWNAAVLQTKPYGSDTTGWMNSERFAYLAEAEMASVPYQAQAFGLFQRMHAGTLDQMNAGFRGFYEPSEADRRYRAMATIMEETGLSITQVVLGYLTSQPIPTFPIVGCQSVSQMLDSLSALDVRLESRHLKMIDDGNIGSELR
jgi:aryl-alcohol dehydrogenase-like predicted oxidoreductase